MSYKKLLLQKEYAGQLHVPPFLVRLDDGNCAECAVTSNDCFPTDVQQATLDARLTVMSALAGDSYALSL